VTTRDGGKRYLNFVLEIKESEGPWYTCCSFITSKINIVFMYITFEICSSNVCYLVSETKLFFWEIPDKFIVVKCSNVDKYSSISFMERGPSWS
jgi:hypothetical protein